MFNRIKQFLADRNLNRILLHADLEEFKAKATAEEIIVDSERRKEDALRRAERMKKDAERWAKLERERVEIIKRHKETFDDRVVI